MSNYSAFTDEAASVIAANGPTWNAISPESVARMRLQNRFKTGLDIAKYTAKIMREDMAAYDADSAQYTQSLGCWHGFIGQQKMISREILGITHIDCFYGQGPPRMRAIGSRRRVGALFPA